MQKKKNRKVNFRINHCSSEDPQYSVTQLLLQSPDAKGWQSKRYQPYPQIIILEIVQPTLLRQISFLSHQSKIATRIQIQCKLDQNKEWKKLGYVSLTSNQNTNFQARQLRSANLNGIPACFIKLTLRNNHINSHNPFNQVGLISLSVYGDKMIQSNFNAPNQGSMNNIPAQNSGYGQSLQLDKATIQKLKQLQIRKKQAVQNQQFDLAKSIKQQIQRIKQIGQTLILMQQKKQQAIKRQDYENAKIINDSMKKLRDQNNFNGPSLTSKPSGNPSQFNKKQPLKSQHYNRDQQQYIQDQEKNNISPMTTTKQPLNNTKNNPKIIQHKEPQSKNKSPIYSQQRPLDVKPGVSKVPNEFPQQQQPQQKQMETGQLEPLNKQILTDCQQYFDVIQEEIFQMLYSKDHKNRENGIKMLKDKLNQKTQNRQLLIEGMLYAIKVTIEDRIASVLINTLELFDQFMKKIKPQSSANNTVCAEFILQKMSDYLGHTNQKILSITQSIYSNCPVYNLTNRQVCYKALTMTYKRQKPPKILSGKLKLLAKIITEYQLGKNYDDVISYAVKYIDDKNNDIRTAAINVICAIAREIGYGQVKGYLKNVRPQILKTIQEQLEGTEGDDRGYDQKPIKSNKNLGNTKKSLKQIQEVDNQFISISKNQKSNQQPQQSDCMCPHCKKFDQRFRGQDYLDMHWFHACPMLTLCVECKQVVQISLYTSHLVGQCQNSKYFKKCPRCKQSVHQRNYKAHVQKKQCLSAKPLATANRCPLCHLDIASGQDGWRQHLVEEGCENNPRK